MNLILAPWHVAFVALCGWVNQRQQQIIEFQNAQIETLLKLHGRKRILLTDDQRRMLAVKAFALGRQALHQLTTIVTPDTILRWHRELVAKKWDHSDKRQAVGRPRIRQEIVDLIVRFAKENPNWGYDRIQGALANVGYDISDSTIANVLKQQGLEPAPDRQRTGNWSKFLKAHWDVLAAVDFTTVEVWTRSGLVTFYLLFVMELKSRRVHLAGCSPSPDDAWMLQVARNLTDSEDGFLAGKQHVLMDRDTKFTDSFRQILQEVDASPLQLPHRSPNLNAYMERFFRSLKSECLGQLIFFGQKSLEPAVRQYLEHYHAERNHQGLSNTLIAPADKVGTAIGDIQCRERLGGMLKYYHRAA